MGLWDAITDAVDAVGDAASDAAESAYDAVAGGAVGDVIATAARAVDTASFGLAGQALDAADDYVFDTVDYVTAGAVDVDFDGGQFTVGAGFDGLARVGASVGEAGVGASGEVLAGGSFDVAMTREGFTATGHAGIDWGPLPYAEGHVELRPNGDVVVNGHVQGTVPTPAGMLSGGLDAGFARQGDSWGGYYGADAALRLPSGVTVHGGQRLSYLQTPDGSHLSAGVEAAVAYQGVGTVGGAVGYERIEHGDDVVQSVHLEAEAVGLGMTARAEADYRHAEVDGVEASDWSGDADFDGPGLGDATRLAASALAPEAASELPEVAGLSELPDVPVVPEVAEAPAFADDLGGSVAAADAAGQSLGALAHDLP